MSAFPSFPRSRNTIPYRCTGSENSVYPGSAVRFHALKQWIRSAQLRCNAGTTHSRRRYIRFYQIHRPGSPWESTFRSIAPPCRQSGRPYKDNPNTVRIPPFRHRLNQPQPSGRKAPPPAFPGWYCQAAPSHFPDALNPMECG